MNVFVTCVIFCYQNKTSHFCLKKLWQVMILAHMQSSKTMHLFPSSSFLYQISSQYLHFHASSFTITFLIRVISGDIDLSLFSLCFWRASHDMLLKHIGRSIIPQVWQFHHHSSSLKVLL